MTTITAFIKQYPLLTYYSLVFAISWGGVLIVVGPSGFPGTPEEVESLLPIVVVAMIAGPSAAAILLTAFVSGWAGFRQLLARLLTWRVGARWYAVALLLAPTVMMAVLLPLSLLSPQFLPGIFLSDDNVSLVLVGMAIALGAGVFEELGWTGFAIPRQRRDYGVVTTGLMVGLVWAAWHWLVVVWASGPVFNALFMAGYLLDPLLFLMPFRVLMVVVYDRTESLIIGILMHVSLTASALIIRTPGIAGVPLLIFDTVWFAALWVIVAAVTMVPSLGSRTSSGSLLGR